MTATYRSSWSDVWRTVARLSLLVVVLGTSIGVAVAQGGHPSAAPAHLEETASGGSGPIVRVSGNHLVNGNGVPVRLIGVDHSGTESMCIHGWGVFDPADSDTPGMIALMKSWNINTVRVPLNEDCWLGINMGSSPDGGSSYQSAVEQYVHDLNAAGLEVILDLHWNAPGTEQATSQQDMADEDHAPAFWTSVASSFAGDLGVIFDLYNEPRNISWTCLVNGGCQSGGEVVAGYNQLISDVRATGATNVIMVAGLDWAGDPVGLETGPGGYPADLPHDPLGQLAVSVHVYSFKPENSTSVWNTWLPLAAQVPIITGELGENDCQSGFINSYMNWADAHDVSYVAWTFNAGSYWPCDGGPSLIEDYSGDATGFGAGYGNHIASIYVPSLEPASATEVGYELTTSTGTVIPFGAASSPGPVAVSHLNGQIVGITASTDHQGDWLVGSDGGVFTGGDAAFYGSAGGLHLNAPIVGMAATPDRGGYWLVASDGGVFSGGDARFFGSTGGLRLNARIVGIAATPDGGGYWLVASDGGVFSFGDAAFYGSTGAEHLNAPIVGMAATKDGGGYWLVASDGGVFSFGDAAFHGSTGGLRLNAPITGMAATPDGGGYWLVGSDGGVYAMGDAPFLGSASTLQLSHPVTGIAAA